MSVTATNESRGAAAESAGRKEMPPPGGIWYFAWEHDMSSIGPVQGQTPIQRIISNPIQKQIPANTAGASSLSPTDKLELSGVSGMLSLLRSNDIRADKVTQIKAQIDAGTYETDQKLNVTVDKLMEDLSE
jgi:anti-sigma28 factor (negative regulator of flagellin synthesis)